MSSKLKNYPENEENTLRKDGEIIIAEARFGDKKKLVVRIDQNEWLSYDLMSGRIWGEHKFEIDNIKPEISQLMNWKDTQIIEVFIK